MTYKRTITFAIIGVLVVIALAIGLPFFSRPCENLLPNFALSQLALSAVAFFVVFVALVLTIFQFRKSMARPLIKVAFNEKGQQHTTLIYKNGKITAELLPLWLINKGNAVARYFQIDFIIPENIGKQSRYKPIAKDNGRYIMPCTNDGAYTLFVNKPHLGPNISIAIDYEKCIQINEDSFEIKYRIYGDWAETQKGKLKVNINKS